MIYHKSYHSNVFLLLLLILPGFLLSSCSKEWFDEKSDRRTTVPDNLADFQKLLDALPMFQQYPTLGEVASDLHYLQDSRYQSMPKGSSADAYIWSKTTRHQDVSAWNSSYEKVLCDNIILEGLEKIDPGGIKATDEWKNIKGQALFNRARVFFELAVIYAPAYDKSTSQTTQGIILRLSSDLTLPVHRSTLEESFKIIIRDANEAYDLLPQRADILTRASKTAAAFLLARIYLYMGNYEEALKNINLCLLQNSALLNLNTIPATSRYLGRYNAEVILHSLFVDAGFTSALVEKSFLDLFHTNDLRKTIFYRTTPANGNITFKGNYESVTNNYFNGFAIDEAYLMRAECYARLNKIDDAMESLNTLLKSRWSDAVIYTYLTASSEEEALQLIFMERKKELNFRGVRWMDLKRINQDPRFAQTITRQALGKTYTLEPNSYRYCFPIPDDVIEQNHLPQNNGWEK